ncbi:MmgE/PrpD family protein [Chloroflexota bacterium]
MTLQRDLVWQNLELLYQSSVAYQYGRYALRLCYEMLPEEVVHMAKRCVLDTLGCAIGAYMAPGRPLIEAAMEEFGGTKEATVFCSGLRTNVLNATLVNSFLVRFLEYNDIVYPGGSHSSDGISSILAIAEREKSDGKDFLTSVVVSYELDQRWLASIKGARQAFESHQEAHGPKKTGIATGVGLMMAPSLGRLMGLNEEQIANAIGICSCHAFSLGLLDSDTDEATMAKNLRFGWCAHDAVLACMHY